MKKENEMSITNLMTNQDYDPSLKLNKKAGKMQQPASSESEEEDESPNMTKYN